MNRTCRGHYKSLHNCGQLEGFSLHPYRQSAYKLYYVLAVEAKRYNDHETDTPVSPSPSKFRKGTNVQRENFTTGQPCKYTFMQINMKQSVRKTFQNVHFPPKCIRHYEGCSGKLQQLFHIVRCLCINFPTLRSLNK